MLIAGEIYIFLFADVQGKSDQRDAIEAIKTNHRLKNKHGPRINSNQGYTFTLLRLRARPIYLHD